MVGCVSHRGSHLVCSNYWSNSLPAHIALAETNHST